MNFEFVPRPIFNKIVYTCLIGALFFIIGVPFSICFKDKVFFVLSFLVFILSLYKCVEYFRICKKGTYEVVTGTCVKISWKVVGKFNSYEIMDDDGQVINIKLGKNCKLKIGGKYKFYFKVSTLNTNVKYINDKLGSHDFLGFEDFK